MASARSRSRPQSRPVRRPLIVLATLALFATAACGTRVPHEEALAVAQGGETSASSSGDGTEFTGAGEAGGATSPKDRQSAKDGDNASTAGGSRSDGGGGGGSGAAATATGSAEEPAAGPGAVGSAPGGGPAGAKAPIVVGMVGNFTGVIGASFAPARDAFKAWVDMVNERGGISGHPVKLYIGDDGNDAARSVAIAKNFVENRKAIALVNTFPAAGGIQSIAKYAQSKNVPVIGGNSFELIWNEHPFLFPASTGFENWYFGQAKTTKDTGKTKIAVVYCTEGAVCETNAKTYRRYAEKMGLEIVYEGRVSLAQPDFTAECLNAQSAGAEVFYPVADGNSANRLAKSCAQQGFEPQYVISAPVDPPASELEGAISSIPTFPWFLETGSPALQEFGQGMRTYAPNAKRNSFTGYGWTNAKLFEKVAANVSDTPTSQDLLNALWSLRNETLGGLARAITFARGKPAPGGNCLFYVEVKGGKWQAPKGMQTVGCR